MRAAQWNHRIWHFCENISRYESEREGKRVSSSPKKRSLKSSEFKNSGFSINVLTLIKESLPSFSFNLLRPFCYPHLQRGLQQAVTLRQLLFTAMSIFYWIGDLLPWRHRSEGNKGRRRRKRSWTFSLRSVQSRLRLRFMLASIWDFIITDFLEKMEYCTFSTLSIDLLHLQPFTIDVFKLFCANRTRSSSGQMTNYRTITFDPILGPASPPLSRLHVVFTYHGGCYSPSGSIHAVN